MPEDSNTPPPVPASLPPVPPPTAPRTYPYQPAKPLEPPTDPVWWRQGWVPLVVLVMAAVSVDLLWPHISASPRDFPSLGLGAAIGAAVYIAAVLMLRRDISRSEQVFMVAMGVIGIVALVISGSALSWLALILAPVILVHCFATDVEIPEYDPQANYRSWWQYWTARRKEAHGKRNWRGILPTLLSVAVGVVLFVAFLGIFASGNPVVLLVWEKICEWWNALIEFLDLDWDFWMHLGRWALGVVVFGVLAMRRWKRTPKADAPAPFVPKAAGTTLLPHLPLMSLIGINLAFLISTSTDIAFLWFGNVPEGISQTQYLHDGAESIIWASVLASGMLIFLFRRNGSARETAPCRFLGYLLVVQTFLLALSVYVRLYHQIADYGFTPTRIEAAEVMLLGLAGLVILVIYMVRSGKLMRYVKTCVAIMALMVFAFTVNPPGHLAGSLNLAYMDSHPQWNFLTSDFLYGRLDVKDNLEFACRVLEKNARAAENTPAAPTMAKNVVDLRDKITYEANEAVKRLEPGRWTTWNVHAAQNAAAAREFLKLTPKERDSQASVNNTIEKSSLGN